MPSNKMIEAAVAEKYRFGHTECSDGEMETVLGDAITTAIDAAWTRYDVKDQSTWPKSDYAPSGHPWLLKNLSPNGQRVYFTSDRFSSWWGPVTDYADPADLTPSWALKDPQLTE